MRSGLALERLSLDALHMDASPDLDQPTAKRSLLGPPMLWASIAAFGTYFCMYAFRKPFTVIDYDALTAWGWEYKTVAVAAQVIGYMISKFLGIKILSEMPAKRRAIGILILIAFAELALVGFGFVPAPYNIVCLFLNGLPLGMVFGLVLGFLEGRKQTEALAAILCTSFILADGVTKSVGKALLEAGVPPFWMPSAAGALFLLPLLVFVWMLQQIPLPDEADKQARSERLPLTSQERRAFFMRHAWGLTPLLMMFLLVTVLRSIRSDFAPQIWESLGVTTTPEIFSYSEIWVGLAVTLANGAAALVSDNYRGFKLALATCTAGFIILLLSTLGQHSGVISPFLFMVLIGIGLYLPYVATHTTIFERLIAMTRDRGNLVHLMYLADSIGYLGYVGVMLWKNAAQPEANFMNFFRPICYVAGTISLLCMLSCQIYFSLRASRQQRAIGPVALEPNA
ncbi:DUF5690 family protein [Aureliella helgolandensis]|uniref:Major Facilitator Superfamily protein n=1 Tax=Aureliella helgolandensis TaxID=2527968 RepID=A0A518GGS9_9BACT|nr:DUF5690 family protein [Aureliella helgolandensis]QDV27805.1 hypothetical protein Q31a_61980 [Aureliella helgolandensis]